MEIRRLREFGKEKLMEAGVSEAGLDADLLLSFVTGIDKNLFFVESDTIIDDNCVEKYKDLLEKRARRIPLQHLTGVEYFFGYEFLVNEHVLIPRSDTEILVEQAIKFLRPDSRVLDICTGSGCIPIALCLENNIQGSFMATDISDDALYVAKLNAKKHKVNIDFRQGDLTLAIPNGQIFDIITSNPPYIKDSVIETLEPEVREYDPYIALSGGLDGLIFYKKIANSIRPFLADGGVLLLEIGFDQGAPVVDIFRKAQFEDIEIVKDYGGNDRVVIVKG